MWWHQLFKSTKAQIECLALERDQVLGVRKRDSNNDQVTSTPRTKRARHRITVNSKWLPYESLVALNETMGFEPLSDDVIDRLDNEVQTKYSDNQIERHVCAVTDVWVLSRDAVCVSIDNLPLAAMRRVLTPGSWASVAIRDYYDCSSLDQRLQGMLLSPRGFIKRDTVTHVWMSLSVLQHLRGIQRCLLRGDESDLSAPRYAIADRFAAGMFKEIDDATTIERQTVGLAQLRGIVKVVYGGPGAVLQSHLLCWDNRGSTISSQVPNILKRENFHLILAGPLTSAQELLLAKRHECSGERILAMHRLLKQINPLYEHVHENDAFFHQVRECESLATRLPVTNAVDDLVAQARARQQSVARPANNDDAHIRESTILETQTVLLETTMDGDERERIARAYDQITDSATTYVARRSTTLLQQNDARYMERLFPHLLTFGMGGFNQQRQHNYSKRNIVVHYLNLSTNRFAEDSMFKMLMFDYLSALQVKGGIFVRVRQDAQLASKSIQITPDQLRAAMENRAEKRRAARSGTVFVPKEVPNHANNVLKSTNASCTKMWGSNEERGNFARKVDAMAIKYGAPTVFWTLTPNPDNSITVAFWSDHELPSGRPNNLSACTILNMPSSSTMANITMGNTMLQANYYRLCCHLLIEVLFSWDMSANKPKAQRGMFGFVEALFFALEQQGRLWVHHHGVAWIAGMPRTQREWEALLNRSDLRVRFEQYCASLFSSELPVFNNIERIQCPRGDCGGELLPIEIPKKYKYRLKSTTPEPNVATCLSCKTEFSDGDVSRAVLEAQWRALPQDEQVKSTETAVSSIRLRFGGMSTYTQTDRVQLSRSLLRDQVHAYQHTASCVKGRSSAKCRYNFYRKLAKETRVTEDNEIELRRPIGCQWLNSFIPLWRRVLHFNMDARILLSGTGLQASRYAMQYATKQQTVLDNISVVELAFKRRLQREKTMNMDRTQEQLGIGRLLMLAMATSGVMEIGSPLATTILLEGASAYFSCSFERLVLIEGLNMMTGADIEAFVIPHKDGLFTDTSIRKYLNRPSCLENWCWYDFCSWFRWSARPRDDDMMHCQVTITATKQLAAHVRTHDLRMADYPRVPEIIGPALPDARRLGEEDYLEQTETYYRAAQLLYCPFRDPSQFLDSSGSAQANFLAWDPTSHSCSRRSLERHQQYYVSLDAAADYRAKQNVDNDDNGMQDEDVQVFRPNDHDERGDVTHDLVPVPSDIYSQTHELDGSEDIEPMPDVPDAHQLTGPVSTMINGFIRSADLPADLTRTRTVIQHSVNKADVTRFVNTMVDEQQEATANFTKAPATEASSVQVKRLTDAIADLHFPLQTQRPSSISPFASIGEVSRFYTFNHKQHMAFVLIAVPLLRPGGTGKSRIVDAVRDLAAAWNRPNAVMVTASTGIAAATLCGTTIHSSIGLGINQTRLPKHLQHPSQEQLEKWDPVLCTIADEMSMADLVLLGLWGQALCQLKENSKPFGGLIAVLMFDHCQLLPVRGTPLFRTSSPAKPFSPIQEYGAKLYQAITKVVYLDESMRFNEDPEWGFWLTKARLGEWTPEFRAFIQSRADAYNYASVHDFTQVVSSDNVTRSAMNNMATKIAAVTLVSPRRVYVAPAQLSSHISSADLVKIRSLPDSQTGGVPVFLPLYVGMPIRIKSNQCFAKGVANGSMGEIFHIDWPNSTHFTQQQDGTWTASAPPLNVFVQLPSAPQSPARFPGLPVDWPDTVMPIYQTRASFKYNGRSISIKAYPLVPAFGVTVHGVQGETRERIAICNLRPPHLRKVDRHAMYVALSRVRTRYGLHWIGRAPSLDDFDAYFKPNRDILHEDARLRILADKTSHTYNEVSYGAEEA